MFQTWNVPVDLFFYFVFVRNVDDQSHKNLPRLISIYHFQILGSFCFCLHWYWYFLHVSCLLSMLFIFLKVRRY
ncbi:AAEL017087-PA [Aedes aegypti]|uniref:AAEL017087-PA n=1 Tax=Aedes aegypti TaxID=7159 RepID=J9HHW4_AEDAE|nr:AAEL017087-PA [Aedes aegypti]